jgi:hypothetical protein
MEGYNPDDEYSIRTLGFSYGTHSTEFPDFMPDLSGIKLVRGAKLTDFLSGGFSNSMILSPRAKTVFEQFNLCPHRFYPMTIHKNKQPNNYFMLHYLSNFSDFVDYEKSTFVEEFYKIDGTKGNFVEVNSKEELFIKRKEVQEKFGQSFYSVVGKKLVMNEAFCKKRLDFFQILVVTSGTYVSEQLKNAIEENGLTGLDFFPAENLHLS